MTTKPARRTDFTPTEAAELGKRFVDCVLALRHYLTAEERREVGLLLRSLAAKVEHPEPEGAR